MMTGNKAQTYRNAMEYLVIEELEQQFKFIPGRLAKYLNKQEVIAFALNRLPSLYATSERGWRQQCLKGKRDHANQISMAVRQGLLAVQKDPLRMETPLVPIESREAEQVLQAISTMLQCEDLSWSNLVTKLDEALAKAASGELHWQKPEKVPDRRSAWSASKHYRH